jgi:hypothetical protein
MKILDLKRVEYDENKEDGIDELVKLRDKILKEK